MHPSSHPLFHYHNSTSHVMCNFSSFSVCNIWIIDWVIFMSYSTIPFKLPCLADVTGSTPVPWLVGWLWKTIPLAWPALWAGVEAQWSAASRFSASHWLRSPLEKYNSAREWLLQHYSWQGKISGEWGVVLRARRSAVWVTEWTQMMVWINAHLWSERENQQDATVRCLISTISQHVSGIIMPIFRRTRCMLLHVVCCAVTSGES